MRRQVPCVWEDMNHTYVSRFRAVLRWGQGHCSGHLSRLCRLEYAVCGEPGSVSVLGSGSGRAGL